MLRRFPKRVFHHGIYVGNGEVIEFTDKGIGKIKYSEFKNRCYMYEVQYGYRPSTARKMNVFVIVHDQKIERRYSREETARRAEEAWQNVREGR